MKTESKQPNHYRTERTTLLTSGGSYHNSIMRAFTVTTTHHHCPSLFLPFATKTTFSNSLNYTSQPSKHLPSLSIHCTVDSAQSNGSDCNDEFDYNDNDDDEYHDDGSVSGEDSSEFLEEDGVFIAVKKLGRNSRRIKTKVGVEASLDDVWSVLTDYERLSEFIPGLVVSKLVEKQDNYARILQIGQQDLPLGVKFSAKAVLDCYERELQVLNSGKRRDIEFKMTEGDFQVFEGKWSIEQLNKQMAKGDDDSSLDGGYKTTLSYLVDVKPKLWLPVNLIEGRLLKEIKTNLTCVRDEAKKLIQNTLHSR